ncbi:unnamed protein product [Colias eurytheme]|nr:unnamed protein product [Colias eurytheme]
MALKVFLVVLACVTMATAECNCIEEKTKQDVKAIWDFLMKIPVEESEERFPVIAGELSPLIPCVCMEQSRKRRSINPSPLEGRYKCPAGTIRFHFFCVKMFNY